MVTGICLNIFRPEENGSHLADNIIKYILLNDNFWISNRTSL